MSHGGIHAYWTRPGLLTGQPNMPASETPYMDVTMTVTPARVKPGTRLHIDWRFKARTPAGAKYLPGGSRQCFGKDSKRTDTVNDFSFGWDSDDDGSEGDSLAFFRVPPANPKRLPTGTGAIFVPAKFTDNALSEPYVQAECAYISTKTDTGTLTIPGPDILAPGTYLVAPFSPMRITGKRGDMSQEMMGTVNEGSAPIIEVLDD